MTRINLVDPKYLCDQHLLAEHRELTRIPNMVHTRETNGMTVNMTDIPDEYTVRSEIRPEQGLGHVRFFYNKMSFLFDRYCDLCEECELRGFKIKNNWSNEVYSYFRSKGKKYWGEYVPTTTEIFKNINRINERTPLHARWTEPGEIPVWSPKHPNFASFQQRRDN